MEQKQPGAVKRAVLLSFVFGFIFILIGLIVISKYNYGVGVVCPFYELYNWHCPGCGGTRMAVAILNGDFYQAFRYNPFVFLTFPVLAVIFIVQSYLFIAYNKLIDWLDRFLVVYAVALIIFAFLRNTETFSWLAPINVGK